MDVKMMYRFHLHSDDCDSFILLISNSAEESRRSETKGYRMSIFTQRQIKKWFHVVNPCIGKFRGRIGIDYRH